VKRQVGSDCQSQLVGEGRQRMRGGAEARSVKFIMP
jgi:hypothetical protein